MSEHLLQKLWHWRKNLGKEALLSKTYARCDKELQQDVVLPSNSKKFLKKVIQKKKIIIKIFVVTYGIYR